MLHETYCVHTSCSCVSGADLTGVGPSKTWYICSDDDCSSVCGHKDPLDGKKESWKKNTSIAISWCGVHVSGARHYERGSFEDSHLLTLDYSETGPCLSTPLAYPPHNMICSPYPATRPAKGRDTWYNDAKPGPVKYPNRSSMWCIYEAPQWTTDAACGIDQLLCDLIGDLNSGLELADPFCM